MTLKRLTRDEIRRAQQLVGRIHGISSCQISTDEEGKITEVHVVATSDKSPKFIARDVESFLKAEMGIDVDHRKIGVVLFETDEEPGDRPVVNPDPDFVSIPVDSPEASSAGTAEPIVEFPIEEYASRFVFHSVNLFISQKNIRAEVELGREGLTAFGSATTDRPKQPPFAVIAKATLGAVSEYLDETPRLCLGGVRRVTVDDVDAVVVTVEMVAESDHKNLAGTSVIASNENQAVVFATLDAVNRVLGKLGFKSAVEYKIK
jgi:hypothetical protein